MRKKRMSIRDWEIVENYNRRMLDDVLQTMEAVEQEVAERIKIETQENWVSYTRKPKH